MSLLSKETVRKVLSEDKERRGVQGKPALQAGEHLLTLSAAELKNSKANNDAMLALTYTKDDVYAPIVEYFKLSGAGSEMGLQKIVTFFASAFKHEMEACEDEKQLLAQVLRFKGKKFKAAVKIQEKLYAFTDSEQKDQMVVTKESRIWYCSTADDTGFKVNIAKALTPLSTEDKQKYMDFKKAHPDASKQEDTPTPPPLSPSEETDESPF